MTRIAAGLMCVALAAGAAMADWTDTFDANIDNWHVATGPASPAWADTYVYDAGSIPGGNLRVNHSGQGGYVYTYVTTDPFDVYQAMQSGNIRFQVDMAPKGGGWTTWPGIRLYWDDDNYYTMQYRP